MRGEISVGQGQADIRFKLRFELFTRKANPDLINFVAFLKLLSTIWTWVSCSKFAEISKALCLEPWTHIKKEPKIRRIVFKTSFRAFK